MHNDGVGLIYMNARYDVPSLGRFASADTIVPDPSNPQQFNRFSYVLNNPIRLIDPSGHCAEDDTACWDYLNDPDGFCSGIDCGDQGHKKWILLDHFLANQHDSVWTLLELRALNLSLFLTKITLEQNGYNWLEVVGNFQFIRIGTSTGAYADAGPDGFTGSYSIRLYNGWVNTRNVESLIFPVLHEIGHMIDFNVRERNGLSSGDLANEYLGHAGATYNWWGTITSGHCVTVSYGCKYKNEAFADSFAVLVIDEAWNLMDRSYSIHVNGYRRYRQLDPASIKAGMIETLDFYFP